MISGDNAVEIFTDGNDKFDALIEDIKNARICHQKEAALAIDRLLQSGFIVTVGNETQIRKESSFFDQVTAYHS